MAIERMYEVLWYKNWSFDERRWSEISASQDQLGESEALSWTKAELRFVVKPSHIRYRAVRHLLLVQ